MHWKSGRELQKRCFTAAKKPFLGNASVVMPQDHPHKHFVVHYMYTYSKLVILIVDTGCGTIL